MGEFTFEGGTRDVPTWLEMQGGDARIKDLANRLTALGERTERQLDALRSECRSMNDNRSGELRTLETKLDAFMKGAGCREAIKPPAEPGVAPPPAVPPSGSQAPPDEPPGCLPGRHGDIDFRPSRGLQVWERAYPHRGPYVLIQPYSAPLGIEAMVSIPIPNTQREVRLDDAWVMIDARGALCVKPIAAFTAAEPQRFSVFRKIAQPVTVLAVITAANLITAALFALPTLMKLF